MRAHARSLRAQRQGACEPRRAAPAARGRCHRQQQRLVQQVGRRRRQRSTSPTWSATNQITNQISVMPRMRRYCRGQQHPRSPRRTWMRPRRSRRLDSAIVSEAPEVAGEATAVADGVWWWQIHNSRIGGATSSCQLLDHPGGAVLVDPLHLADDAFATLPAVTAICLTAKCHQRSAWRYRRATGAPVWAPEGAPATDEEPDHRYRDGDRLPGGLLAVRTPGPEPVHYCFLAERTPPALICSDLLSGDGALAPVRPVRVPRRPCRHARQRGVAARPRLLAAAARPRAAGRRRQGRDPVAAGLRLGALRVRSRRHVRRHHRPSARHPAVRGA